MPLGSKKTNVSTSTPPQTQEEQAHNAKVEQLVADQKQRIAVRNALRAARNAKGNLGFKPHYCRD